jgi:hypothetical protein
MTKLGIIHGQRLSGLYVLLIFLLLMLLPSGCVDMNQSGSSENISVSDAETASTALTIRWHDTADQQDSALVRAAALDCTASGVENIICTVYDASGNRLVAAAPWPCAARNGTIEDIPVGQDRTFVVLAEDANGNIRYQGEASGITVSAGENPQVVVVDTYRFIPNLTAPDDGAQIDPYTFSLEWEMVQNADEYLVQVADDIDFQSIAIDETTPAASYAPTTLAASTQYFWKVSAVDLYTNIGTESEVRSFVTADLPTISGTVSDSSSAAISGVTVTFSDGTTATTDTSGRYSKAVSDNWSGSATPSMSGYTFSPASRDYSNVTADQSGENYTGTPITPLISGEVQNASGDGISGVTVTFSDGTTATTDASGRYSKAVSYNWSGSATPSMSGYTFSPASRDYSNVTADQSGDNYTGTPITPLITGEVQNASGAGISGVTVTFSDGTTATTDASGRYSKAVSYNWNGSATPSMSGYTFSPASRDYSNITANQSGENYTGTPITPLISGEVQNTSGDGISGVTVTFSDGTTATTDASGHYSKTVSYSWSGTATASSNCYTFSQPSKSYSNVTTNQSGENYTGTLNTYSISGYVRTSTYPITGIYGVTMTFSNGGGTTRTNGSGYYSHDVSCGWSGTVTLSRGGDSFTPPYKSYSDVTSNIENENYTGIYP